MNNEEPSTSGDLIRRLKMLTLPRWVRGVLSWIMVAGALSPAHRRHFAQDLARFHKGFA
jgi:hypothetical protein